MLLNLPDGEAEDLQSVAASLENPFVSELKIERDGAHYGWLARPGEKSPLSIPAFWTAMSLAVALRKDAYPTASTRERALEH